MKNTNVRYQKSILSDTHSLEIKTKTHIKSHHKQNSLADTFTFPECVWQCPLESRKTKIMAN